MFCQWVTAGLHSLVKDVHVITENVSLSAVSFINSKILGAGVETTDPKIRPKRPRPKQIMLETSPNQFGTITLDSGSRSTGLYL